MTKEKKTTELSDWEVLKRLLAYVIPSKNVFYFTIFLTIFLAIIGPVRPWLIQKTVDGYIKIGDLPGLTRMTIIMIALLLVEGIANFTYDFYANVLAQSVIKDLRLKAYSQLITYKLKFYDKTTVGSLVTRVISDIESISNVFSSGILTVIGDLLKLTVVLSVMFYTNWKLTFYCLSSIPFLILGSYWFKESINKSYQAVRSKVSAMNTFVQEHVTGMSIVQIFNRQSIEMERFKQINEAHKKANIDSIWAYSIFFPLVELLSACSLALLVWFGTKGVLANTVSFGELMAFILYIHMLFRPIRQLADNINVLQMGVVSARRVFHAIDENAVIQSSGNLHIPNFRGEVEFKNVWFAYESPNWILKDISFKVEEGKTLAVVGSTGSGKTSIVNLISKFYDFEKGQILISGHNLNTINIESLRKHVIVVSQDIFLFSDTIFNNITLGDSSITLDAVIDAAKEIGVHDFIEQLPGSYQYNVRERGLMLSVGQRQLIAFVRAYVHKPTLLILDEATSSIDQESERLIQIATQKLTKGRTSIVIAHRLSTIQAADEIMVVEKGEIIEKGNHQTLLQQNGRYKKLYEVQFELQG